MTTAVQLAQRRRTVARSRARRPARTVPPAPPPRAAILAYAAVLTKLGRAMDAEVIDVLARARVVRSDGPADGGGSAILPSTITDLVAIVRARLLAIAATRTLPRVLAGIAVQVDLWGGEQFVKGAGALLGIDPDTFDVDTRALRTEFRDENLSLIKTLARDKVDRVRDILREHGPGGRVERIQKAIEEETGATPARAALIARDQVLSLNAQVTQERHVRAGITHYVWRTSRDARVRTRHRALEGRTFEYAEPPVVDLRTGRRANPGQDFRCRCTAEPVVPGLE